jgi:hypothetical protein
MEENLSEPTFQTEFTLHSIEALLSIVATEVDGLGHAFLFSGDRLALDLPLGPVEGKNIKWGMAAHHDWAFEATLLRFAKSHEPARLLIASGQGNEPRIAGWIIGHSTSSFWAARMPQVQARLMFGQVPR